MKRGCNFSLDRFRISSIGSNKNFSVAKSKKDVPWGNIWMSFPFWGLLITHFCYNWTSSFSMRDKRAPALVKIFSFFITSAAPYASYSLSHRSSLIEKLLGLSMQSSLAYLNIWIMFMDLICHNLVLWVHCHILSCGSR